MIQSGILSHIADNADPNNVRPLQSMWNGNKGTQVDKHLLMCKEIHQLYLDDQETHIRHKMLKWLLQFAARVLLDPTVAGRADGVSETVASVVGLMKLPGKEKFERAALKYLLENRKYLFFENDDLWTVIGDCHCDNYASKLQPVGSSFKCYNLDYEEFSIFHSNRSSF